MTRTPLAPQARLRQSAFREALRSQSLGRVYHDLARGAREEPAGRCRSSASPEPSEMANCDMNATTTWQLA
jgi:hypothetical protein